jgi:hypothetical protein
MIEGNQVLFRTVADCGLDDEGCDGGGGGRGISGQIGRGDVAAD